MHECASALGSNMALDDVIVYFQTMPQTTSAVALWMVKLDSLIAPYLESVHCKRRLTSMSQLQCMLTSYYDLDLHNFLMKSSQCCVVLISCI